MSTQDPFVKSCPKNLTTSQMICTAPIETTIETNLVNSSEVTINHVSPFTIMSLRLAISFFNWSLLEFPSEKRIRAGGSTVLTSTAPNLGHLLHIGSGVRVVQSMHGAQLARLTFRRWPREFRYNPRVSKSAFLVQHVTSQVDHHMMYCNPFSGPDLSPRD